MRYVLEADEQAPPPLYRDTPNMLGARLYSKLTSRRFPNVEAVCVQLMRHVQDDLWRQVGDEQRSQLTLLPWRLIPIMAADPYHGSRSLSWRLIPIMAGGPGGRARGAAARSASPQRMVRRMPRWHSPRLCRLSLAATVMAAAARAARGEGAPPFP